MLLDMQNIMVLSKLCSVRLIMLDFMFVTVVKLLI
jgi:hypothetical protein